MLFNSLEFIFCFLPITAIIYFVLLKYDWQLLAKIWLVVASLFFYNWWNPKYTPILIFSIIFNFVIVRAVNSRYAKSNRRKLFLLTCGIGINLVILIYFKYMGFFIENVNSLLHTQIDVIKFILPLGISFFTFQQITYLIDSYRDKTAEYDFLNYALFVSFFPQLIAGPIVHHKEIIPQFYDLRTKIINNKNIVLGVFLFLLGLFKKTVLADTFSTYVANGYNIETHLSVMEGWIVSLGYTFQLYFDFSGYTDMALGSAKIFNIELPLNFNSPYKSTSIKEFWRNWHITLSRFLRDYIYIPLGGGQSCQSNQYNIYRNLMITFLLGGLWHGASWMFVLWGALHGVALCLHRVWNKFKITLPNWICTLITFMFINITWIFFRAENMTQAKKILLAMVNIFDFSIPRTYGYKFKFFNGEQVNTYQDIIILFPLAVFLVFMCKNSTTFISSISIHSKKKAILTAILFSLIFLYIVIGKLLDTHNTSEFIYFNF